MNKTIVTVTTENPLSITDKSMLLRFVNDYFNGNYIEATIELEEDRRE